MFERERFDLEFKEEVSKTFLKTVSAFANYNDGSIVFGVADDGEIRGFLSAEDNLLRIKNRINDTLDPRPEYKLETRLIQGKEVIILKVFEGEDTPYYYQGKAYKRSDTSTVPVDRMELSRLVLSGMNLDYENRKAQNQSFEFKILEKKLMQVSGISELTLDILKILNLYDKDGFYNVAGELLADENTLDSSGVDIVRFGETIDTFLDRETVSNVSLFTQYDRALEMFERYYEYEEIVGYSRVKRERIPKKAFREAIANALVHREWDRNAHIQISMYGDRVEISSPGGLPDGVTEEDYLHEQISELRNPIIASVFNRLNLIEKFGTGVRRIKNEYKDSFIKPEFNLGENNIRVMLPVVKKDLPEFSDDEFVIYELFSEYDHLSRQELDEQTGFSKNKTLRIINKLSEKNIVEKVGRGPQVTYRLNKLGD